MHIALDGDTPTVMSTYGGGYAMSGGERIYMFANEIVTLKYKKEIEFNLLKSNARGGKAKPARKFYSLQALLCYFNYSSTSISASGMVQVVATVVNFLPLLV